MKVLLIDDEEDIRKVGHLSLEKVGKFQTLIAACGREGLDLAASNRPDLILMDMMMPGMDGLTALAELRQTPALREIPVIFMTAKVQRNEIARYISMGALGVIQKPFDPMTLPAEIRKIMDARAAGPR
jgi:two-component system OmpR family response regulator